ncbi:MAG TPA: hypothetical protein VJC39_00710 [Candidatus Nanoarchaeia archaeon]|nr:hypothetical protein [Candidatus Nanoarchaeia archaeon]
MIIHVTITRIENGIAAEIIQPRSPPERSACVAGNITRFQGQYVGFCYIFYRQNLKKH